MFTLNNVAGYHVENFGCRASQADGAAIAAGLQGLALSPAHGPQDAEVIVVNTCSVTAEADREARAYLRKVQRLQPGVRIVVTGCYAQRAPQEVAALPGVDRVVGNSHKALVASIAASLLPTLASAEAAASRNTLTPGRDFVPLSELLHSGPAAALVSDDFAHADLSESWSDEPLLPPGQPQLRRTRPNLKVQDGCGNRCSFCVIPQTRGSSRSVARERVLAEVHRFVEEGGQEMVLSGINLGQWGRDLAGEKERLTGLVEAILDKTALTRLRISSVEPMDWTAALMRERAPRLARHAHLPLQSGADAILRAMHRRYRPWHYAEKVAAIREQVPDAAIGADVMVGFPGETGALFEETARLLEQLPITYLHLFPFSARPGTPAWTLHGQSPVPGEAVRERMARLRALAAQKHRTFCERFTGQALSAITLETSPRMAEQGRTRALTDNFLTAAIEGTLPANQVVTIYVDACEGEALRARR